MSPESFGPILAAALYGLVSGFNDGGNLLASFTSARVISPRLAVVILVVALAGPLVIGYSVAQTVATNVIDLQAQGSAGFVMLVAASLIVVLLSWRVGIPTSMTLALVGAMIGWVLTGGEHRSLHWSGVARVLIGMPVSVLGGGLLALIFYTAVRRLLGGLPHASLLRVARLQFAAAAIQAFGYGANDMEKTVGLLVAARSLTHLELPFPASDEVAAGAAFLLFAVGAVVGGARVMRRMGFGVLRVRPMQALAQQVATGAVVSVAAVAGAPVSMTQTIDGGLVGVGAADRASSIRWGVVRDMLASWVVTLPVALVAAALLHVVARIVGLAR